MKPEDVRNGMTVAIPAAWGWTSKTATVVTWKGDEDRPVYMKHGKPHVYISTPALGVNFMAPVEELEPA